MVIAQTNLQLYNQLIEAGWGEDSLSLIRDAYDLSRMLFSDGYRPSHKPFICHLVGTASVLAHWNERTEMVAAGMLHSAYLYGYFGDHEPGASEKRRAYLQSRVGKAVESLVYDYTTQNGIGLFESSHRDITVLLLADLYDELTDCGAAYSDKKKLRELEDASSDPTILIPELVSRIVGSDAAKSFVDLFRRCERASIPECLKTDDASWKRVKIGVPGFKKKKRRKSLFKRLFV